MMGLMRLMRLMILMLLIDEADGIDDNMMGLMILMILIDGANGIDDIDRTDGADYIKDAVDTNTGHKSDCSHCTIYRGLLVGCPTSSPPSLQHLTPHHSRCYPCAC